VSSNAVRIAVARQEALDPERVAAVRRADQHDAGLGVLHQPYPAQDEGSHDDLANVRLGLDHAWEHGSRHPDDPAFRTCVPAHQDFAIVEQVELAGELALAVEVDRLLASFGAAVGDLDRAFQHDEEVDAALAAREQGRALGNLLGAAELGDPIDLSRVNRGKVCASRLYGSVGSNWSSSAIVHLLGAEAARLFDSASPARRPAPDKRGLPPPRPAPAARRRSEAAFASPGKPAS
jgi:hypothetical protein